MAQRSLKTFTISAEGKDKEKKAIRHKILQRNENEDDLMQFIMCILALKNSVKGNIQFYYVKVEIFSEIKGKGD